MIRVGLGLLGLLLFVGCRHLPPLPITPPPDLAGADYIVIAADVRPDAVLCVEVTPLMRFWDPLLAAGALCGETIADLRARLQQQRRAN